MAPCGYLWSKNNLLDLTLNDLSQNMGMGNIVYFISVLDLKENQKVSN